MVETGPVFLFIGQDSPSKDTQLQKLKKEFLNPQIEKFNCDILYAKDLILKDLQERLLSLPFKAKKRIAVIKNAQELKEDIKEFILEYVKRPYPEIILVLDIDSQDEFTERLARYVQTHRFKEPPRLDAFVLSRQIELRKPDYALKVLHQLLENGERPELILGGLRHSCNKNINYPAQVKKINKLLLNCDLEIKTGRVKSNFALEKLVVRLCNL